jgi:hypothetical protein
MLVINSATRPVMWRTLAQGERLERPTGRASASGGSFGLDSMIHLVQKAGVCDAWNGLFYPAYRILLETCGML